MVVDEALAEIVPVMLRSAGYQCDAAYGDKESSEAVGRAETYALIFCQVAVLEKYPEFLSWVSFRRDIPIISAAARPWKDVPKVIRGRCIHLPVPFERDQMLALVRETLRL